MQDPGGSSTIVRCPISPRHPHHATHHSRFLVCIKLPQRLCRCVMVLAAQQSGSGGVRCISGMEGECRDGSANKERGLGLHGAAGLACGLHNPC